MTARRWAVEAGLAAWFAATVGLHAGGRLRRAAAAVDPFRALLPDSRFFAPRPAADEKHLLVRDQLPDGTLTAWAEPFPPVPRRALQAVWNPDLHRQKTLWDALAQLRRHGMEAVLPAAGVVVRTPPYLYLLTLVTRRAPHHPDAVRTQFLVVSSGGHDEGVVPSVEFRSALHDLPGITRAVPDLREATG